MRRGYVLATVTVYAFFFLSLLRKLNPNGYESSTGWISVEDEFGKMLMLSLSIALYGVLGTWAMNSVEEDRERMIEKEKNEKRSEVETRSAAIEACTELNKLLDQLNLDAQKSNSDSDIQPVDNQEERYTQLIDQLKKYSEDPAYAVMKEDIETARARAQLQLVTAKALCL